MDSWRSTCKAASSRTAWLLAVLAATGIALGALAQGGTVQFSDANLEFAVREALGRPTGDIRSDDLAALESLFADRRGIVSLAGLGNATNLRRLSLRANDITDLSPLAGLTALVELDLGGNRIADLTPLTALNRLTQLWLPSNEVSDLSPLAGLASLTRLDLSENRTRDLSPLSSLTNLEILVLSGSEISDLTPLAGLAGLKVLRVRANSVADLSPLAGLTALESLTLRGGRVRNVSPLAALTSLQYLRLDWNEIRDLSPLTALRNLRWLYLEGNEIEDLSPLVASSDRGGLGSGDWAFIHVHLNRLDLSPGSPALRDIQILLDRGGYVAYEPQSAEIAVRPVRGERNLPLVHSFVGHWREPTSAAFIEEQGALLTWSHREVIFWDLAAGRMLRTLDGVIPSAISPDASLLALRTQEGEFEIWDVPRWKPRTRLELDDGDVIPKGFTSDGRFLLTTRDRVTTGRALSVVEVWDAQTGRLVQEITQHAFHVCSLAVSPDGGLLALGEWEFGDLTRTYHGAATGVRVALLDLASGRVAHILMGHSHAVRSLAFSPDGALLASASSDGTVNLWNVVTGALITTLRADPDGAPSVTFSPDGTHLASAGVDDTVKLWDVHARRLTAVLLGTSPGATWFSCVSFSADGRLLAAAGSDKGVMVWDVGDLTAVARPSQAGSEWSLGNVIRFPDPQLEAAIREALGKPAGDITAADMLRLTSLERREGQRITDLTGLEHAVNLRKLWLPFGEVSDVSPLAALVELEVVGLHYNRIADLSPLADLVELWTLWLQGNEINDLSPLSSLTRLRQLLLGLNPVSDLSPLAALQNLTDLSIVRAEVRDIAPLGGLHSLRELTLADNHIDDFAVLASLRNLKQLDLSGTGFREVRILVSLSSLEGLRLVENGITDADLGPISYLRSLRNLDLRGNRIRNLAPLAGLIQLRQLGLGSNSITDLSALAGLRSLEHLDLCYNQITDLSPLADLTELQWLMVSRNGISDLSPLASLVHLEILWLTDNRIRDLTPLSELEKLERLLLGWNAIADLSPLSALTNLWDLGLAMNGLVDISPLVSLSGLTHLDLRYNQLSDLSVLAQLSGLENLSLEQNDIDDLSALSELVALTMLNLRHNRISDTSPLVANSDAGGLGAGSAVDLRDNRLSLIPGSPAMRDIQTLTGRGVDVYYIPQHATFSAPIAQAVDVMGQPSVMHPGGIYRVTARYFHPEGRDELQYCYLRLRHPTKPLTMMWSQADGLAAPWAGEEGANYLTEVSATARPITQEGVQGYELVWSLVLNEGWPEVENAIDFGVYAIDISDQDSGWDFGGFGASFRTIQLGAGPRAPIAAFRHYPSTMARVFRLRFPVLSHSQHYELGQEITFDARASHVQDGSITAHRWDFGDGTSAQGDVVTHTYSRRGAFKVRLVVEDERGVTDSYVEQLFIAIPRHDQAENLRDGIVTLVTTSENLLLGDIILGSEEAAAAAQEFHLMAGEDLIDALYSLLVSVVPSSELGLQKSEIWRILIRPFAESGGEFLSKGLFRTVMTNIMESKDGYGPVLSQISLAAESAGSEMNAARSEALSGVAGIESGEAIAFIEDLRLRLLGNLFMAQFYRGTARALYETAEIARQDRDSFTLWLGKFFWNVGITAGLAATGKLATLGPIVAQAAGLAATTADVLGTIEDAGANLGYWLLSHYALRRGGTEPSTSFPVNVLEAIHQNVMSGLLQVRDREPPSTLQGKIEIIESTDANTLNVRVRNTGSEHAGRFRLIVGSETRFTSYELFRGAGRYYMLPYAGLYPDDEQGWYLRPGEEKSVSVEIPDLAPRAQLYLLGQIGPAIYGLDQWHRASDESRTWTERVRSWFRLRWGSPVEVALEDAHGRITGLSDGQALHEIPYSFVDDEEKTIWVLSPISSTDEFDGLTTALTGIADGTYRLEIEQGGEIGIQVFSARDVPVLVGSQHRYAFSWEALAQGKDAVTIEIDQDGDAVFERTIQVGTKLTREQFGHTIIATSGEGGTIDPKGAVTVAPGADQVFTITPQAEYEIAGVWVNGVEMGPAVSHSFNNVGSDHTIHAVFALKEAPADGADFVWWHLALVGAGALIVGLGSLMLFLKLSARRRTWKD